MLPSLRSHAAVVVTNCPTLDDRVAPCGLLTLASVAEAFQGQLDRSSDRYVRSPAPKSVSAASRERCATDHGRPIRVDADPPLPFDLLVILPGGGWQAGPDSDSRRDLAAVDHRSIQPSRKPSSSSAPLRAWRRRPGQQRLSCRRWTSAGARPRTCAGARECAGRRRCRRGTKRGAGHPWTRTRAHAPAARREPAVLGTACWTERLVSRARELSTASMSYVGRRRSRTGSDAFGGVISMISRQPSVAVPLAREFAATLGAGVPAERIEAQAASGLGAHGGVLVETTRSKCRRLLEPGRRCAQLGLAGSRRPRPRRTHGRRAGGRRAGRAIP